MAIQLGKCSHTCVGAHMCGYMCVFVVKVIKITKQF